MDDDGKKKKKKVLIKEPSKVIVPSSSSVYTSRSENSGADSSQSKLLPKSEEPAEEQQSSNDQTVNDDKIGKKLSKMSLNRMMMNIVSEEHVYNPFEHRNVAKPTNDLETLMHLLKGVLGSGILSMPYAYKKSGFTVGIIGTIFAAIIITYGMNLLVKTAHVLLLRNKKPVYSYHEVVEESMNIGPLWLKRNKNWASFFVDVFIILDIYSSAVCYSLIATENIKSCMRKEWEESFPCNDLRCYIILLLPLYVLLACIRQLKYLAPFSLIANIVLIICLCMIFYKIFQGKLDINAVRQYGTKWEGYPIFFSITIFALQGCSYIISLENNMKNPPHLTRAIGILNIGMFTATCLYVSLGCLGYLRWGNNIHPNISTNLPKNWFGNICKLSIAFTVLITYAFQFFVLFEILWRYIKKFQIAAIENHPVVFEYLFRIFLSCLSIVIAVLIPSISSVITLISSIPLSFLGLIFPAMSHACIYYDQLRSFRYFIIDFLIIFLGFFTCFIGTYVGIIETFNLKIDKV